MRTIVNSVTVAEGPPENLAELNMALAALRGRYPGATIDRYLGKIPQVAQDVYVAPTAVVVGEVILHAQVSIWHGAVVRGDVNRVEIRQRSNIQDGAVVHLGDLDPTFVDEDVVVGHRAVLHGCHIGAGSLIGIQATVLDGVVVGEGSIIGAGSIVTAGTHVPARSLVLGIPGKVIKQLSLDDELFHRKLAGKYTRLAQNYLRG